MKPYELVNQTIKPVCRHCKPNKSGFMCMTVQGNAVTSLEDATLTEQCSDDDYEKNCNLKQVLSKEIIQ